MKKQFYFLFLLFFVIVGTVQAQFPSEVSDRLQFVMDSVTAKYKVKGVSAAILVPGRGIWKGTSGISHEGVPLTTDMAFCMGSNTKTYISALFLKLQEQGKIDLDDTIGKWIQGYPNITGHASLRQCLSHTTGIADYFANAAINDSILGKPSKIWTYAELFSFVTAPSFQPGSSWEYSNTNYIILGEVLRQVMGQSPFVSLEEQILEPNGLDPVYKFGEQPQSLVYAHPWSMNINGMTLTDLTTTPYLDQLFSLADVAGGLITTPEQNVKFWHLLFEGYVINAVSLAEMTTMKKVGGGMEYGLGIMRRRNANNRVVYEHGGTFFGYLNENLYDTVSKTCITVFTNQDSLNNGGLQVLYVAKLQKELLNFPVMGVPERNEIIPVHLYPNPANSYVRIESEVINGPLSLELIDLNGKTVHRSVLHQAETTLDIRTLAGGVYMLKVSDPDGNHQTQKLVITR
ncbi:MAG: serine hydrolase [Bacteroidia bacterium]